MVCLGFATRNNSMVGADNTTELWRPPLKTAFYNCNIKSIQSPLSHPEWSNVLSAKLRWSK